MTTSDRYVILTALQFDETGEIALQEAVRIARRDERSELHVVHVVAPSLARHEKNGDSTSIQAQLARAPGKIRDFVDRAAEGTGLHVTAHVRSGTPIQVILQTAADLDADVLVLGTHTDRSAIDRLVVGSVAARVLQQASCPVMVAIPKAYLEQAARNEVEPPCEECVAQRRETGDLHASCERHSRARLRPHVYAPSDHPRPSQLGT